MMHLVAHYQAHYFHWMHNVVVIVEHRLASKMNECVLSYFALMQQVGIASLIDQLQKVPLAEMDR